MWKDQYTRSWAANSEHCSGRVHTRLNVTEFFLRIKDLAFRNFFMWIGSYNQLGGLLPDDEGAIFFNCALRSHGALRHQDGLLNKLGRGPCVATISQVPQLTRGTGPLCCVFYSTRRDGALWGQNYVSAKFGLVGMACTDAACWIDLTRWQKCQKWPI